LFTARGRKEYQLYPMSLRKRLPTIAIPLREADDPVALDFSR